MQGPDDAGKSGNKDNGKTDDSRQRNSPQVWHDQIRNSFFFSPYWNDDPEKAFTSVSIVKIAEEAEKLLEAISSKIEERLPEMVLFLQENADSITSTVMSIGFKDDNIVNLVTAVALKTQRQLAEFGELESTEASQATMLQSASSLKASMGGTGAGYMALTLGDASAALASQRAGLPEEFGRAVFAANLVLELRDALNSKL